MACLERLGYEVLSGLGAEVGEPVFSAGGGSRSDAWLQMRADTLRKPVARPALTGAAMGAAILAASLAEFGEPGAAVRSMVRIERQVEPRRDVLGAYEEKYALFVEQCRQLGYLGGTNA